MKIYTRTGDSGETSLFGGDRVPKSSLRIDAYGTVDELNSAIGLARSLGTSAELDVILDRVQRELFILGADLATPLERESKKIPRISQKHIDQLERDIDATEERLSHLSAFILPGGSTTGAVLHLSRTICRRAERTVHLLMTNEKIGENPLKYLNRLSDALFVFARDANRHKGSQEVSWLPPAE